MARAQAGDFLLRIEDIDLSRSRPEWEAQIFEDLAWLGISWTKPVLRQSNQMDRYNGALDLLWDLGLLYPCTCNRRDIKDAIAAPQEGVPTGPDGIIYPGTCRDKPRPLKRPTDVALRLNVTQAVRELRDLSFEERIFTSCEHVRLSPSKFPELFGDIVLARKDMGTSYHLSVVLDDAAQEISDVIRGEDLFDATAIHVLLQKLLGQNTPIYHHHRLIRDEAGKRLAKRDDAKAISAFREQGLGPKDIRRMVGLD